MKFNCPICNLSFDDVSPWIRHKNICKDQVKPVRPVTDVNKEAGVLLACGLCECKCERLHSPERERPAVARPNVDVRSEAQTTVQQDSVEGTGASRTCVQCKITKSLDQYYNGKYTCKECTKTDVICPYCRKVIRKTNLKRHIKNIHKK